MAIRYSGHWLQTRRQAAWQSAVLLAVLVPLAAWRFTTHPLNIALPLAVLTMVPFAIAFQTARFLAAQERVHGEPTPEMAFMFRFVVNTPLTFGVLLFLLQIAIS